MAHAQKPDFVFRRNGRAHLNRRGRQFSRLLAAELCASAAVMLDTPCSEAVWRVLATHSIRQFPLHFPCRASPCVITFQRDCTYTQSSSRFHFAIELVADTVQARSICLHTWGKRSLYLYKTCSVGTLITHIGSTYRRFSPAHGKLAFTRLVLCARMHL